MPERPLIGGSGTISMDHLRDRIGEEVGLSDWILVDQARIDAFAEITEDRQALHIDPVEAARSDFGGTIAHGFLTLSLVAPMSHSALPVIDGLKMGVNYGMNSLRFLAPVRSGSRIRGRFTLKDLIERSPGRWQVTVVATVEIEGETRPALVAEWIFLNYIA